jgi:hypothetical protein
MKLNPFKKTLLTPNKKLLINKKFDIIKMLEYDDDYNYFD